MKQSEIQKDHARLLKNMKLIQQMFSVSELSEILDISANTWTNRMKQPWKAFSYDDFKAISKFCKVDFVTLVDGELKLR